MPATNSGNSASAAAPPNVMVIFDGSGDLTRRKRFPSLHHPWKEKPGPGRFAVDGVGRDQLAAAAYRDMRDTVVREHCSEGFDGSVWVEMPSCFCHKVSP
jgi:glucose-6-phosphate 1-dehydrogenase